MKFTVVRDPIPFLIIDDTYDKEEQIQIYKELDYFVDRLESPDKTGSAKMEGNLKSNRGVFLDEVFAKRNISSILSVNRKLFNKDVKDALSECHYAYNLIGNMNYDATLLSYYDNGGSYFSHIDSAVITNVTWFFKEPKNFTGGKFIFSDYNLEVEVKNNRTVMFFSSYRHEVTEVNLIDKSVPASGRFTLSNFCSNKS